ncbi:nucleotide exchange factor GrpE [Opitutus sp. GAS368]|jgi:molecular chaperone GrpE|uniref:nucleotide exchange factor GrpE n=1 Tax=Opitutus sp. GAS368 TaxID=1882749 RepID=UPI00087A19DC|nr:nucleotide exchange factor GrpE [Opitutus sp. GAS368]SDS29568.1 molecular chaperone GrpE [Opitutus sp. GAS368]
MSESSSTDLKDTTPAATPEPAAPAAVPKPEEQLAAAKQEAAANYDRYMRAVADLENFRKRTLREKDELRQFAASGLMEDVIPILDNLSLGLAAAKQQTDVKAIVDGVNLVLEQFKTTLARHGLKEIKPEGQRFDPNFHECISHQPSTDIVEEHVMQVVRPGYALNGRLLRPASVIVSSGPTKETQV